jgi:hypothetical protein
MTEKSERSKQHFNDTVDYEQTVRALLAFTALVVHDGHNRRPNSEFGFGRRMWLMPDGPEVTPDLVAQKSATYGVVAEAKKSLGRDDSHWLKCVEQGVKYSGSLKGWFTPTEMIPAHDSVILIHISRSRKFSKFIDKKVSDQQLAEPKVAVVEFNQSEETTSYYFFRLERGQVTDAGLSESLEAGKQVPLAGVLKSFPNVRYYDAPPPTALLLSHLWTDFFPTLAVDAEYDEKTKSRRIRVAVSALTDELQRAYGSSALHQDDRAVKFPKQTWVRDALERLVKFRLARRVEEDGTEHYDVLHRNFKRDVRQYFCDLEAGLKEPKAADNEVQPLLEGLEGGETSKQS